MEDLPLAIIIYFAIGIILACFFVMMVSLVFPLKMIKGRYLILFVFIWPLVMVVGILFMFIGFIKSMYTMLVTNF